jgi:hypothetical protein
MTDERLRIETLAALARVAAAEAEFYLQDLLSFRRGDGGLHGYFLQVQHDESVKALKRLAVQQGWLPEGCV